MTKSCWTAPLLGNDSCRSKEPLQNWQAAPMSIAARDKGAISQLASWIWAIFPQTACSSWQHTLFLQFHHLNVKQTPADWPTCKCSSQLPAWPFFFYHLPSYSESLSVGKWLKCSRTIRPQPGRWRTQPASYCSFHLKLCEGEGNYASPQRPGRRLLLLRLKAHEIKEDRRHWSIPRQSSQTNQILS